MVCVLQLAWVWSQGSATVEVAFATAKMKLVTTTLQAVVLLHLQQGRCTVGKLATITGIDFGMMKHIIGSMATVKGMMVVAKRPAGPRVSESDEVEVDWAFKSPKRVRAVHVVASRVWCVPMCVTGARRLLRSNSLCQRRSSLSRPRRWT
jgi:hypothetical protein